MDRLMQLKGQAVEAQNVGCKILTQKNITLQCKGYSILRLKKVITLSIMITNHLHSGLENANSTFTKDHIQTL